MVGWPTGFAFLSSPQPGASPEAAVPTASVKRSHASNNESTRGLKSPSFPSIFQSNRVRSSRYAWLRAKDRSKARVSGLPLQWRTCSLKGVRYFGRAHGLNALLNHRQNGLGECEEGYGAGLVRRRQRPARGPAFVTAASFSPSSVLVWRLRSDLGSRPCVVRPPSRTRIALASAKPTRQLVVSRRIRALPRRRPRPRSS